MHAKRCFIYIYIKKRFLFVCLFVVVCVCCCCFVFCFGGEGKMLSGTIPAWLKLWPGSSMKFGAKSSTVL